MTDVQIRSFLALAEELNFTKASKRLCITQSTLSSHISSLEKNMGVSLFDRNNKTVALSAEGQIIYPAFKQAFLMMAESIEAAKVKKSGDINLLRIAFIDGMSYDIMSKVMKLINVFRKDYPMVNVQVQSTNDNDQVRLLENNQLDLAFSFGSIAKMKPELEGKMIYESHLCILYLKEDYKDKKVITWDDVKNRTFYIIDKEKSSVEVTCLKNLQEKFGEEELNVVQVNSMEAKMFYVSAGYGVGFADQMTRLAEPERFGRLSIADIGSQYGFIFNKNRNNKIVNKFLEYVSEHSEI